MAESGVKKGGVGGEGWGGADRADDTEEQRPGERREHASTTTGDSGVMAVLSLSLANAPYTKATSTAKGAQFALSEITSCA